ncbi:putative damage-inducible protein DinB [Cryobacterium sp. CAN_C3]|uniref:mycothiol transferase n=1 Tax=unclassified Cryobacterium TaxID=2649013 RepID=UPI0018CBD181|nr:DinB family protein [Cryobacterium sp. CAN_C3]MEC5154424.1 putative damage-inducible protein DinB [Cryobacterium sp. CAN_C3]
MTSIALLIEAFECIEGAVHGFLTGTSADALTFRADADANTIAWLVWHLTRVQDDHVAELAGNEQTWTRNGWEQRFGLPFEASATGYGQSTADIAAVRVDAEQLGGYYDDVHADTIAYLETLTDGDLDEVIDRRWTSPVTRGVRLVSVISDDLQHAGQAAFIRGIAERAGY